MARQDEYNAGPFVRIVGEGSDVMIEVGDVEDIAIAHQAIDLAFSRFKAKRDRVMKSPKNLET